MDNIPACPTCGGTEFIGIPDSLAVACRCGFVWVEMGIGKWEPGATLQQWMADIYEASVKRDRERALAAGAGD